MEDSETEKDEGEPPPSKKKSLFNDSIVGKVSGISVELYCSELIKKLNSSVHQGSSNADRYW